MSKKLSQSFSHDLEVLKTTMIGDAVKSVHQHEKREFRRDGCLEGLKLCEGFHTIEAFQSCLDARLEKEEQMRLGEVEFTTEEFWRHRCATAQVEFIYERMRVLCDLGPTQSAGAVLQVSSLIDQLSPGMN